MPEVLRLHLATLDSFYSCVTNPDAQRLFADMATVRHRGYGPDYPENYLPLDASDYISRLHICYADHGFEQTPVATLRSVSLAACDHFNVTLPLLESARLSGSKVHLDHLESILHTSRAHRTPLLYSSRLTVSKSTRTDRALCERILELAAALVVDDFDLLGAPLIIAGAAIRFGTLRLLGRWGFYQLLSPLGEKLPPFPKVEAGSEPIQLIALRQPSQYARDCHRANKSLLDSRFTISSVQPALQLTTS